MEKSSLMVDLDDPRIGKIASVISSKTAKRILGLLSDGEMSASEIASELKSPLNTVDYNLKKLVESGLIEKSKKFFWSTKGKRIEMYKIAKRKIIISPSSKMKGIIPAAVASVVIATALKIFTGGNYIADGDKNIMQEATADGASVYGTLMNASNSWAWFLIGAMTALAFLILWIWRKDGK